MTRARAKPEQIAQSLLCTTPGCLNRWTCGWSQRLCGACASGHRPSTRPLPLPTREPVRPYAEPADRDDPVEF